MSAVALPQSCSQGVPPTPRSDAGALDRFSGATQVRGSVSHDPEQDDSREVPLSGVSDSEIHSLVDEVLRSGKHLTLPARSEDAGKDSPQRLHAGAIARQMQRLAHQITSRAPETTAGEGPDELDEWWFEIEDKRIGPISLRKVRYLWEEGELTPDSLCWHEGFTSWVSLFQVSELAEALAPRPAVTNEVLQTASRPTLSDSDQHARFQPSVGEALETQNRRRLSETQKAAPVASAPAPVSTEDHAGTFATLPTVPAKAPQTTGTHAIRARRPVVSALISGLAAGGVIAATFVAVRFFWPEPPTSPVVVVVREEAKAPTQGATRPAPSTKAPEPTPKTKREPKRAKPAGSPASATTPAPSAVSVPAGAPASVDEAFARAFAPEADALETSEIFAAIAARKAEVEACKRAHASSMPEPSGRLVMRWRVDLAGKVTDVGPATRSAASLPLVGCLQGVIAGMQFPKHEVPHGEIEFPFVY